MGFKMIFTCVLVKYFRIREVGCHVLGPTVAIGIVCGIAILCWHAEVPLLVGRLVAQFWNGWHGGLGHQYS